MSLFNWKYLQRILCIGAHADDIEIGCGGTILKLLREAKDAEVCWVVLSADKTRSAEAERSARAFLQGHACDIKIHEFPDCYFGTTVREIKQTFFQLRDRFEPDVVFTHRLEDRHQDHRLVAEVTWNTFRNQPILEYEIPKYEGDLGNPNLYSALSRDDCAQKIDLLQSMFPSQVQKPWYDEETFWGLLRLRGLECSGSARYAEGFTARKITV